MEDSLIKYETAKLAKEKGFPQKGNLAYNKTGNLGKRYKAINYAASTQSLLQKWLREVHNIDVDSYLIEMISNDRQLKQDLDQREYCYRMYKEGILQYSHGEENTYEGALETGLQEGLKLIRL